MSESMSFTVLGAPVPLQRSRTRSGRHYLPPRSRAYRQLVQASWMAAGRPSLGAQPFALSARFYGARANADLDNLLKAVLDALNGLAFDDDSQLVCFAGCHKLPAGDGARTEVDLWAAGRGFSDGLEVALAREVESLERDPTWPWRQEGEP